MNNYKGDLHFKCIGRITHGCLCIAFVFEAEVAFFYMVSPVPTQEKKGLIL